MVRKILNHRIAVFAFVLGLIAIIGVFGFSRYNEVEALSKYNCMIISLQAFDKQLDDILLKFE